LEEKIMKRTLLIVFSIFFLFSFIASAATDTTPIKIGVPGPFTGPYAQDGLVCKQSATFAVEEINKEGGILGRPLEMYFYDVEDVMPEKVMASAQDLCMGKKVNFLFTTWVDYGVDVKSYGRFDAPYFSGASSTLSAEAYLEDPDTYFNFFEYQTIELTFARDGWVRLMNLPYEYPNHKVFVVNEDDNWCHFIADEFVKMATNDGWKIAGDENVIIGNSEWGGILTKIRSTDPSIIFFVGLVPSAEAAFLKQFQTNPTNSIIYLPYVPIIPEFKELAGESADGVLWTQLFGILPSPEADVFKEKFIERWGAKNWRVDYPAGMWDVMQLWKKAVEAVGDVEDYRAIVDYIEKNPYEGFCGKYVFPPETHIAVSGDDAIPIHYFQIQDGKDVQFAPEKLATGEFVVPKWIKK
jgi:branched-chain amino acid transport system substrate-binding protein